MHSHGLTQSEIEQWRKAVKRAEKRQLEMHQEFKDFLIRHYKMRNARAKALDGGVKSNQDG